MGIRDLSLCALRATILLFSFSIAFSLPLQALTNAEFDREFARQKLILDIYHELRELDKICRKKTVSNVDDVTHKLDSFVLGNEVRKALEMRLKGLNLDISCNLNLEEMEQLQEMLASMKSVVVEEQQGDSSLSMWAIAGIALATVAVGTVVALVLGSGRQQSGQRVGQQQHGINHLGQPGVAEQVEGQQREGRFPSYGKSFGDHLVGSRSATPMIGSPMTIDYTALRITPFPAEHRVDLGIDLFKEKSELSNDAVKLKQTCDAFIKELHEKEDQFYVDIYAHLFEHAKYMQPELAKEHAKGRRRRNSNDKRTGFEGFVDKIANCKLKQVANDHCAYEEVCVRLEQFKKACTKICTIGRLLAGGLNEGSFEYAGASDLWGEVREGLLKAQNATLYGEFSNHRVALEDAIGKFKNDLSVSIPALAEEDDNNSDGNDNNQGEEVGE